MGASDPWRVRWCFLLTHICGLNLVNAIGFCLIEVPSQLEDTDYTAVSNLTEPECAEGNYTWCPLDNATIIGSDGLEYYYYSACCSGFEGQGLIADSTGLPTCKSGISPKKCTTMDWLKKVQDDLFADYDKNIAPSDVAVSGVPVSFCSPNDDDCEMVNEDGTQCNICRTSESSSNFSIYVGLHIFKVHALDLQTSELSLAVWMRYIWDDRRLSFHRQCYGGLASFDIQAQSGELENSRIWVPDIELYNAHQAIWQGGFSARLATVFSCPDNEIARDGCGNIFFSRPGVVKVLCKYQGLTDFPYDALSCQLEMAAWAIGGQYQDIVPRPSDGGITWPEKPGYGVVAGLTASSMYQDYTIRDATVARVVVFYDCCPNDPYPELMYTITFVRATNFYVMKMVVPPIVLTVLNFITFWVDPSGGERLTYAITMILAMLTLQITFSNMMPISNSYLFIDHLTNASSLFTFAALLETSLAIYIAHLNAISWKEAFMPFWLLNLFNNAQPQDKMAVIAANPEQNDNENVLARNSIYRKLFFQLDVDFSEGLTEEEVSMFGRFMLGNQWDPSIIKSLIEQSEHCGKELQFNQFARFCETTLPGINDLQYLTEMVDGFISVVDRTRHMQRGLWQERALQLDQVARWVFVSGYILFLSTLYATEK